MDYYVSVDGGGTKLLALLFDQDFRLVGEGRGGAVNPSFTPLDSIKSTMSQCIQELLASCVPARIRCLYIAMPGPRDLFIQLLAEQTTVDEVITLSEGRMCLLAGLQQESGMTALAGTGSGVFWMDGKTQEHIGGWGALLGDEGSGFCIGRAGLMAAIYAWDGRGPKTVLEDLVASCWSLTDMRELLGQVYGSDSPRLKVASAAPLVAAAAQDGDVTAQAIYEQAGSDMARQAAALVERVGLRGRSFSVVTGGGAWKGSSLMRRTFAHKLAQICPAVVCQPLFEPVMGGVVHQALRTKQQGGWWIRQQVRDEFAGYLYPTDKEDENGC